MRHKALLTIGLFVAGCASVEGMRSAPLDQGEMRYFQSELRPAVLAVRNACVGSNLDIEEVKELDDETWWIIAKRTSGGHSYGELIRIVIHDERDDHVGIRIFTRRRVAVNVTAKSDWSNELFTQIELELGG